MPAHYAWLTFACVLCVLLNVSLSQAADDEEHVHIKVRMPELARKQPKTHKYHRLHYHKSPYAVQILHHPTYQATKYKKRAIKPIVYPRQPQPLALPPRRPAPLLTHNHLDMSNYGDSELGAGFGGMGSNVLNSAAVGMPDPQLLYSSSLAQKMPDLTPNYGPAAFGNLEGGGGAADGSNNAQHYEEDATTTMVTMPGSSQKLMQHMELMGALAAAAAAAAAAAGSGESESATEAEKGASGGGGADETNTLLANDFLAQLQNAYDNRGTSKYPTSNVLRRKKKRQRVEGLSGDNAETYRLNVGQQELQQQSDHQELLKQHYKQQQQQSAQQHFFGANYMTQHPKPQAFMYERAPAVQSHNNNYAHYKNKYYYTTTPDASHLGSPIVAPTTAEAGDEDADEVNDNAEEDDDIEDDESDTSDGSPAPTFYYTKRPSNTAVGSSPLTSPTTTYNGISDYEDAPLDDRRQEYVYKTSNNNNNNYYTEAGVNPFSYHHSATAYAGAPQHVVQPLTPTSVSHIKLHRPYRQLQQKQQQKYQYNTLKAPAASYSAHHGQLHGLQQFQHHTQQQHQHIVQPINVIGPSADDFDEPQQQQYKHTYATQQQSAVGGLSSSHHKKRNKNRIKAKFNRNRIPTQ